jgi:hypothetical protein
MGDIRQTEMHTAEPFVPEPSASKVEVASRQVLIRFQHNLSKQERKHYILRAIN